MKAQLSQNKWIADAKKLDDNELARHAKVGRVCSCNECFCCAAKYIQGIRAGRPYENRINEQRNIAILGGDPTL